MRLAGDLAEFSLPDLLQVKSAARQTAGLRILGPEGNGLIVLREGEVVHAQYEELLGEVAFHALMGVKAGYFEAAKLDAPVLPTIHRPMRELLLDAFRLAESGDLPRPARRAVPLNLPAERREPAAAAVPVARPRLGGWQLGLAGLLLGVAVVAMLLSRSDPSATVSPANTAVAAERVFESSELSGAGDRPPTLVSGVPPAVPNEAAAVLPTVVCRLRVDAQGEVVEAKVYRSRLEFAEFEELAIRAAQAYRFRPALHAGKPVSAWINLPVEFR